MAVFQKFLDCPDFKVVVVFIDLRPHFHFFEGLDFLFFPGVLVLFLKLIAIFSVVQYSAHRGLCLGSHLNDIKLPLLRHSYCLCRGHNTYFYAVFIDEQHFPGRNFLVNPGISVFFSYYSLSPP